eukprot:CAMPEP_0171109348 /NCGR_PEP_ID=MMETSP0766_2-20121228/70726_1 /TAXON_ID=439317 /ORGANISM="Gambierdiscus australes, Strain CAWD 149" /LENGTH=296 /DNA_ID=CAMNT_0011571075 /DNA_START=78 /DNA_END=968 /DNA_ORIENTATION=-
MCSVAVALISLSLNTFACGEGAASLSQKPDDCEESCVVAHCEDDAISDDMDLLQTIVRPALAPAKPLAVLPILHKRLVVVAVMAFCALLAVLLTVLFALAGCRCRKREPPEPDLCEENASSGVPLQAAGLLEALPPPVPRLRHIGASYVVPAITRARSGNLEVSALPALQPLRAALRRERQGTRVELTVGVESLLWAEKDGAVVDGEGTAVASISMHHGHAVCRRSGHASWDIEVHEGTDRWVGVLQQGEKIAQATSFEQDSGFVQVDTQPEIQSPESAMLLLCCLAVTVLQPPEG